MVIAQLRVVERMSNIDDFVRALSAQNGQVASRRAESGVKSISPSPPVHAHGSFAGSTPAKENRHCPTRKSTSTTRT
ncbi:MAG: hypothetical protein EBW53_04120 [Actinobacteria bacterium]|nr:hypothetical protein [Actinomycetota bacterium]